MPTPPSCLFFLPSSGVYCLKTNFSGRKQRERGRERDYVAIFGVRFPTKRRMCIDADIARRTSSRRTPSPRCSPTSSPYTSFTRTFYYLRCVFIVVAVCVCKHNSGIMLAKADAIFLPGLDHPEEDNCTGALNRTHLTGRSDDRYSCPDRRNSSERNCPWQASSFLPLLLP